MFEIGSRVVCVNDNFERESFNFLLDFPVKNDIYTVRDIIPAIDYDMGNTCAVLLEEIRNPLNPFQVENGFDPSRFVPLEEISEKLSDAISEHCTN